MIDDIEIGGTEITLLDMVEMNEFIITKSKCEGVQMKWYKLWSRSTGWLCFRYRWMRDLNESYKRWCKYIGS